MCLRIGLVFKNNDVLVGPVPACCCFVFNLMYAVVVHAARTTDLNWNGWYLLDVSVQRYSIRNA